MPKPPEILPPDHPAYAEAVEAMRRYHEARDAGAPVTEVERLRLIAESLYQAITDYQMKAFGKGSRPTH
ncbi:MAG: hypothetical protein P0Y58_16385 [Candidatus Pseudomonas phytovorans]|uniref:Uncharacterized protein n=1 Tax=Candidatus Pseudomonas phytovorans TaxID=3121377 RepID=A0AAJ5WGT1_9PSED|nr:hypothetical protein [Pseudomonas sp.]WEK28485.1 MAG: hypothetical protein P0Y58_16385 [Pseudomonas sp.]